MAPAENLAYSTQVAIFPIASYEKPIVPVDILFITFACFCRYYGANLEKSLAL